MRLVFTGIFNRKVIGVKVEHRVVTRVGTEIYRMVVAEAVGVESLFTVYGNVAS